MNKANDCLMIGSYDCSLNGELFLHTDINQLFFCLRQICRKQLHFEFESVHVCEPYTGLFNQDFTIYMLVCMSVCWFVYKKYVCQNA